jgi:uncharacterized membrane protein YkoI
VAVIVASMCFVPACTHMAKERDEDNHGGNEEEKVKVENVPAAVRTTIDEQSAGGAVEDIARESEDGKTIYEVDVKVGGKDYELKIAEDGKLISKKLDEDEEEKDEAKETK